MIRWKPIFAISSCHAILFYFIEITHLTVSIWTVDYWLADVWILTLRYRKNLKYLFMQKGKTEETCITEFVIKLFPLTKRKKEIVSVNYFTTTTKRILGIHWNCILKATIQLLIQFNFLYDLKNSFGLWKNFDLKKKMIF